MISVEAFVLTAFVPKRYSERSGPPLPADRCRGNVAATTVSARLAPRVWVENNGHAGGLCLAGVAKGNFWSCGWMLVRASPVEDLSRLHDPSRSAAADHDPFIAVSSVEFSTALV
jgi:hypothetical protein